MRASAARRLGALTLVLGPGLGGCIPSNVVAPAERRVLPTVEELTWLEPEPADVPGFYRSESVAGPMASVVQALYYLFRTDGTYTGAALLGADRPTFQTLTGTWELTDGRLRLDQAPPAELEVAEDRLRLTGEEGRVVLRREPRP